MMSLRRVSWSELEAPMAASINADPDRATNSELVRRDVSNESHLNGGLV
jgi:hypothetical protein